MKRLLLTAALVAAMIYPVRAEFLGFGKKEPVNLDDARSIMQSIGSEVSRAYVTIDSSGGLIISVYLKNDLHLYGFGTDMKTALQDLVKNLNENGAQSKSAADAVSAVINQGRASQ